MDSLVDVEKLQEIFKPYHSFVRVDNDGGIDVYVYGTPDWNCRDNKFSLTTLFEVLNLIKNHPDLQGIYKEDIQEWINKGYYGDTEEVYLTFSQDKY